MLLDGEGHIAGALFNAGAAGQAQEAAATAAATVARASDKAPTAQGAGGAAGPGAPGGAAPNAPAHVGAAERLGNSLRVSMPTLQGVPTHSRQVLRVLASPMASTKQWAPSLADVLWADRKVSACACQALT